MVPGRSIWRAGPMMHLKLLIDKDSYIKNKIFLIQFQCECEIGS